MFHNSDIRSERWNFPADITPKIKVVLNEFTDFVTKTVNERNIMRAMVRSMLACDTVIVLDSSHLFVVAQKTTGVPSTLSFDHRKKESSSIAKLLFIAKWVFGYDDPFVVQFPADILDQPESVRAASIEAIAYTHITSELSRVVQQMRVIQINPIFGPASYSINQHLVFVLMPFTDKLTEIYKEVVKPTIEGSEFELVCHRADDIKSNKAIIQDIWKSICEARLIIADLSELNPNVMYELGIAHTLGKETVLLYQRGDNVKFPFDLTHIRRIEYDNSATGGKRLENDLRTTLENILTPTVKAMP